MKRTNLLIIALVSIITLSCQKKDYVEPIGTQTTITAEGSDSEAAGCAKGEHYHRETARTPGYCCLTKHWWVW